MVSLIHFAAFDVRGDVKIFDFGLSKGLSPSLKAKDSAGREIYGYNLTPRTVRTLGVSILARLLLAAFFSPLSL